ncbi:hypothetical protein LIER_00402 [Lithospermum erythrorhizon]|uniref:Reverse transcriptase Ty1/copia-type domain-containing protein n=1 Tax=Lithospermum erythrorhizon TaxID=34254 RepID=A0AAV3NHS0_LITER
MGATNHVTGYLHGKKGWRLFGLNSRDYFVSRDVTFYEFEFPYHDNPIETTSSVLHVSSVQGQCVSEYESWKSGQFVADERLIDAAPLSVVVVEPRLEPQQDTVTAGVEPRTFKEAMDHLGWHETMTKEMRALEDNDTWCMVPLPDGKKTLGSRWVYKVKYNSYGSIERLKVRLVIFENHQVEGIDYNDIFAPVAKMVTVRTFLAIAVARNCELH